MLSREDKSSTPNTLEKITKRLALPTVNGVTLWLCWQGKEMARDVSPHNAIKNQFSLISSAVDTINLGVTGAEFFYELIRSGQWRQLSLLQGSAVAGPALLGATGVVWLGLHFAHEQNTLVTGLASIAGGLAFEGAKELTRLFVNKNAEQAETQVISLTGRPNYSAV